MRAAPVAICLVMVGSWSSLRAQDTSLPRWVVSAGGGVAFRTEYGSSLGGQLRLARVLQPTTSLFLEPGLTWHGYSRSSQFNDLCPIEGCPPARRDAISLSPLFRFGGVSERHRSRRRRHP